MSPTSYSNVYIETARRVLEGQSLLNLVKAVDDLVEDCQRANSDLGEAEFNNEQLQGELSDAYDTIRELRFQVDDMTALYENLLTDYDDVKERLEQLQSQTADVVK